MIRFNTLLHQDIMISCKYGRKGSPWEFNLRDVFRWCDLIRAHPYLKAGNFVDLIYLQRMRTLDDREQIKLLYEHVFEAPLNIDSNPYYHVTPEILQVLLDLDLIQLKHYS